MNYIHTIRVGETDYAISPAIDDASAAADKTWSAQKLSRTLGNIDQALDSVLALQQTYLGGAEA